MFLANRVLSYDAWGRPKAVRDYSLFSGLFTYDIPDELWKINENGSDLLKTPDSLYVSSVNGYLNLTTSTNLNDVTTLQSKRHPRYQPNRGHLYSSSIIIQDPSIGKSEFGLFTPTNGVYFRIQDGKLYCVRESNNVELEIIEAKLDTDKNGLDNIDLSKGCIYDIQFQWRGVGNYYFYVNQQLVGTMTVLNTLNELSIANPALPISFRCTNTGNGAPILKCGCVDVSSEGGVPQSQILKPIQGNSFSATNDVSIAVRINSTFNGKYNTRDCSLLRILSDVSKKCSINIYRTRDVSALTINTGSWVTVDGSISVLKPTASGQVTLNSSKVNLLSSIPCVPDVANIYDNPNPKVLDIYLTNGDYLIVSIVGSAVTAQTFIELGAEV